ncbi:MAG: hypothetical protein KFKLKKLM_01359 [Flavobacteriales bacterium]|nr:hypothetical protein [Flavobacteriales bacterium]
MVNSNIKYELSNHLGNVHVVVSDRKLTVDDGTYSAGVKINSTPDGIVDYYSPDVLVTQDFFPGGMLMPGRNYNPSNYSFGWQGQFAVDEVSGVKNHYTTQNWEYDPRTLRRWEQDPLQSQFSGWSPYSTLFNNPIRMIDPTGLAPDDYTSKRDGTIEVKKTDDNFDRFSVENKDGSTTQVAQLDKIKASDGKTDLVKFPSSGAGFTRYGDEEVGGDSYVQPKVAAAIFGAVNEFSEKNPDATVQLGNMSSSTGGKPGGSSIHKGGSMSHVLGRNVDARYIRKDRGLSGVTVFDMQFDRGASQNLVNAFNKFGFKSALSHTTKDGFLLNKTTDKDIQLYNKPVHHNHIHFQGFSK